MLKRFLTRSLKLSIVGAILCAGRAYGGAIMAELDRAEGSLGESFLLTLSIEGSHDDDPAIPEIPGLILRQQGVNRSMSIINGQVSGELHVSYGIYPQKAGEFQIPSITMIIDGKKEATLPLTLKVLANGAGNGGGQGVGGSSGSQNGAKANGKSTSPQDQDTGGVAIERLCPNTTPLVGQQVLCTLRVLHQGNLNGGSRISQSSADFRRFDVEGEKRYQEAIGGQRYGVIELKEIVVPMRSGSLELPPYALQARVLIRGRGPNGIDKFFNRFGGGVFNFDMGFTEEKEVTLKSPVLKFEVRPLPEQGKPPNFHGLVGVYQLSATTSKTRVKVGETVTITITISGEGILDQLVDLPLNLEQYGKVYPDKPEYSEQAAGEIGIRSTKTFKFALVPTKEGELQLGKIDLPVFDPKQNHYVVLTADLGQLTVDPGKADEKPLVVGNQTAPAAREDVKVLAQDLIGPHPADALTSRQDLSKSELLVLAGTGGGSLLLGFGLMGFAHWRNGRQVDPNSWRRSQAFRSLKTTFAQATSGQDAGRAFRTYIGDKLGTRGEALTAREVLDRLNGLGLQPDTLSDAGKLLHAIESAEYGGTAGTMPVAEMVQKFEHLAQEVEKRC